MNISSVLGGVAGALGHKKRVSVIIVAAGSGLRFGGVKKQFINVCGVPALKRTVTAFEKSEFVNEIIVVTGVEDIEACRQLLDGDIGKLKKIVPGGKTRQESARYGLEAISDSADFVAIHDGARCLITAEEIDKIIREAFSFGCVAAAQPAVNTVKYTDDYGIVKDTIDREHVWLVETPQIFPANAYRAGVYSALKDDVAVTDDCMLVERLGFKVKMISVGRNNIKLTYPEDLTVAEAVIREREKGATKK